jgi:hypothetical protein
MRSHNLARIALGCFVMLAACSGKQSAAPGDAGAAGAMGGLPPGTDGAALFAGLCSRCHGPRAQGGTGPALSAWTRGRQAMVEIIDARMPLGEPDKCNGECAGRVADHILGSRQGALVGADVEPSPRRLRLLSRAEYRSTVTDLFGGAGGPACSARTFSYDSLGRQLRSVHVAGDFNGWAPTVAAGGWALTQNGGRWTLAREVPPGVHAYKFVLDERDWITDPTNPDLQPDGFGGQNSVFTVTCAPGGGLAFDPTARFPVETRPEGFPFDGASDAQTVTAVHVEEYRAAARTLADSAARDVGALLLQSGVRCEPAAPGCAGELVRAFGLRAFRRPLTDAELTRYQELVTRRAPDVARGVSGALQAMLSSPHFLYRSEVGERQADGTYRLTGYEIASALSYQLWGTMPDAALLEAARAGELAGPEGIERQARRLLADPRARGTLGRFALQWLGADTILGANKSAQLFPGFDEPLRAAMAEETRRFVAHVVFDSSHKLDELLTADYTFANQALAGLYGMANVSGAELVKTPYPDGRRAGLLGHASVLGSYAHSDQTSPIRRGLFVRRRLLCQELPPPPPNAGGVPPVDPGASTRDRFRQHTDNAFCQSCHQYIDSVGFGFEHFDPIGRWREAEGGRPIDAAADMNDVERLGAKTSAPYGSLPELGRILADSESARQCFARQYHQFARGAADPAGDSCGMRPVLARFRESGWDIRELMVAVTLAPDFVVRK